MAIRSEFSGTLNYTENLTSEMIVAQNLIDFSKTNVAASDVVEALKVQADCFIAKVAVYVITEEGATSTCTVGDDTVANGWDASANLNSAGAYISTEGTDTYGLGKFYTVNDTIDLTISADTALDKAKVLVVAYGFKCIADLA